MSKLGLRQTLLADAEDEGGDDCVGPACPSTRDFNVPPLKQVNGGQGRDIGVADKSNSDEVVEQGVVGKCKRHGSVIE